MATKYYDLQGLAHWAKLRRPDEFRGTELWSITLEMDEDNLNTFKKTGVTSNIRDVGDGKGVILRRAKTKLIKGETVTFDPPVVRIWDVKEEKYLPFDGLIGNGSKVSVNIAVFDTANGPGHRMQSVTILDLIPYEPEDKPMETPPASQGSTGDTTKVAEEVKPW